MAIKTTILRKWSVGLDLTELLQFTDILSVFGLGFCNERITICLFSSGEIRCPKQNKTFL